MQALQERRPPMTAARAALIAFVLSLTASATAACGRDTDCVVERGTYRIAMPEGRAAGAIVYFHGFRGSAAGVMRNGGLLAGAAERGLAVVAPNGVDGRWSFPGAPHQGRDEIAFMRQVHDDMRERFDLPADRIMVSGFSTGGTMAWYMACDLGGLFAGFAPVAGAYWEPLPETCPSDPPVLMHVHGTSDRTVPMQGRPIGPRARQGDVRESIAQWRRQAQCGAESQTRTEGRLTCERWTSCETGLIELCLHDGGHSIRSEWVLRAWDELAAIKGWE